jgi:hypothetical protein
MTALTSSPLTPSQASGSEDVLQQLCHKILSLLTRGKKFGQWVSFIVMSVDTDKVLHSSLAAPSHTKWQVMIWLYFFKIESGAKTD